MTLQTKKWRKQSKDDTSRKRRKKEMKTLQTLRIIGKGANACIVENEFPNTTYNRSTS